MLLSIAAMMAGKIGCIFIAVFCQSLMQWCGSIVDEAGDVYAAAGNQLFASFDDGENWQLLAGDLPKVRSLASLDFAAVVRGKGKGERGKD